VCGCAVLVRYITRYVREHYDVVKLRKEVAERLREFAESRGLTISDAISYLLTNMGSDIVNNINDNIVNNIGVVEQVASDVADYVLRNYGGTRAKLLEYPGGDYFIFDDLNRVFTAARTEAFVEVFGGSCWCSLNVSRSKFKVVVCNDIDRDLITLYRLVKEKPEEVIRRVAILPFSRELNAIAVDVLRDKSADPVTRAVMLFYAIRTSFSGEFGRYIKASKVKSEARTYANVVASIAEYAKRFRDVVLECKDFREVLKLYDSERTLFYLDPPYVGEGRDYYRFRFTVADLKAMAWALKAVKGYWVLKISEDNYRVIKDLLPSHELAEIRYTMYMEKAKGEERSESRYIVAHNVKTRRLV